MQTVTDEDRESWRMQQEATAVAASLDAVGLSEGALKKSINALCKSDDKGFGCCQQLAAMSGISCNI